MSTPTIPPSVFAHARAAFLAAGHTLENVRRDFPEWHLGRRRYALWALDVDLTPVRAAVAKAARHLDGLLLDGYHRQPHITLALCGFPTPDPIHPDDYGPAALDAQLAALQAACITPFQVEIGTLASFSSAPFLTVADIDGGIARLRHALTGERPEPGGPFTPHVTVGLYRGAWPTAELIRQLDAFDAPPPFPCPIEGLSLMSYAAAEIGGPLDTLAEFSFAKQRLLWRNGGPTDAFAPARHARHASPP